MKRCHICGCPLVLDHSTAAASNTVWICLACNSRYVEAGTNEHA